MNDKGLKNNKVELRPPCVRYINFLGAVYLEWCNFEGAVALTLVGGIGGFRSSVISEIPIDVIRRNESHGCQETIIFHGSVIYPRLILLAA